MWERCVWKILCDKVLCVTKLCVTRLSVTKLCERIVRVCDKAVCDKDVWDREVACERDVCERLCVTKLWVTKLCVREVCVKKLRAKGLCVTKLFAIKLHVTEIRVKDCALQSCVWQSHLREMGSLAAWISPSATSATPNEGRYRQVPHLPRKTKVDVSKCHTWRTKRRSMPAQCHKCHPCHARSIAKCHACHTKCRGATGDQRRESAPQPAECHMCHACHAKHRLGGCRQVPRLPRKVQVYIVKRHACHAKCRGATCDQRRPSAPPEPAQCHKCHPCHAKRRSMSASATPATQNEGPVEGTGGGRGSGGAVGPTYFFVLSLDVMNEYEWCFSTILHLFHHFHIDLRACIVFVHCWRATVYVMTLHTGWYHVNERCHRANPCFYMFFICFWCFFRWAGDRMSWAHVFRRAGVTQTYRKKIGMVLLVPKADDMCTIFLCQKKRTWQMTWE